MRKRVSWVAVFACSVGCAGGAIATAGPGRAGPPERAPAPGPASEAAPAAAPGAAPGLGRDAAPGAAAPAPRPAPLPVRPTTIALSTGTGDVGNAELTAGDDAFASGDLDAAQRHYGAARAAAPKGVGASVGLARVQIARVGAPLDYAAAKGNRLVAAAARDLVAITRAAPAFGPTYVELGEALLLLGNAPEAIAALRTAVRLLPDAAEAQSQLGIALLATGHAPEAVTELARAAQQDPGSPARHGNLGTALLMAGRTKEAIAEYETRARIDDGDARAHSDLGTALLGTGDLERALAELKRAVDLDPTRPSYRSNLGYAMQQAGRKDRAIVEYRAALRLDPTLVSAWINLATALAMDAKTRGEARAALEKARLLSPDDPRVKANFEELDDLDKGGPSRRNE